MSKRFVYHEEYFPLNISEIIDSETGETYDCEDVCELLNNLYDENENYKSQEQSKLKEWRFVLDDGDIELEDYHIDLTRVWEVKMENKALRKENEQLRKQLNFYLLDEFEWKEKYGDGV